MRLPYPDRPHTNRPHFDSISLGRTISIEDVDDLNDKELKLAIDDLSEALGMLNARLDELSVLYGTPDQEDPVRYGRMRFKARALGVLHQRMLTERGERSREKKRQDAASYSSTFIEVSKQLLSNTDFERIESITRKLCKIGDTEDGPI